MAATDLQRLVDGVGRRLQRAVALDDPHLHLLAYTSHVGTVDAVRTASIMHRSTPSNAAAWVQAQGIRAATQPVRLPPNPSLGMDSRVCAPVRCQGRLLGFLWLVDADQNLGEADLEVVAAAADAIGEVLHRQQLVAEIERARERELLRDLVGHEANLRSEAAREFIEAGLVVAGKPALMIVARLAGQGDGPTPDADRVSIALALDDTRRTLSPRHSLHLVRPDHALMVVVSADPVLRQGGARGLGQSLYEKVVARIGRKSATPVVGIGETQRDLETLHVSYEQALQAAKVAEIIPSFGPVAMWPDLGIYQLLLHLPVDQLTSAALHPGLSRLLTEDTDGILVGTLECYLDVAGDIKRTASKLRVHRATLYYRLHKAEAITGLDLTNGDDRLALHLGLKLARLSGILAPAAARSQVEET